MKRADLEESVLTKAFEVFESSEIAQGWMTAPCRALGGATPRSLLLDDRGFQLVMRELHAIEHGLPI
ncbi:hypothetical protein B1810_14415 [Panacagrimonas perspica]|uniref:MbcA/ParS/Xre antitoxin family protein n=1 Tax=Panacagrimonas perspica TaxID=381431 RepID=UPI0011371F53|nr:hypothetical protein B1810_14415 [Panacagrimonas perspica]